MSGASLPVAWLARGDGMAAIELCRVTVGYYPGRPVVTDLSLSVAGGSFCGIIGPNGSGKTTLLRVASGALHPQSGEVLVDGRPLGAWTRRQLARTLAVVPQLTVPPFAFTVREYVALGRTPYVAPWARLTAADVEAVDGALQATGLESLASRPVTELSGGELQQASVARALAQQPKILLLDEPTAFLDPAHCIQLLDLLARLNRQGLTILATFHDLNLAAAYCREIVAVKGGRIFAAGSTEDVFSKDLLEELFETPLLVEDDPQGRRRVILLRTDVGNVA
ncbi:MAG: ABC transporter ATP-binding protein [Armatimonadetes bacterium]|nr:ABC transporter ATP-binding protein [Armatimonadota bacterium]